MPSKRPETSQFVEAVAEFIRGRRLLVAGSSVVVGVSGGADSVALLAALRELAGRTEFSYWLTVAHLNHLIRPDADQDARFVAELAERWGLPCIVERRDVPAESRRRRATLEQAAREVRYEFLLQAAVKVGAGYVAVAHHADDNVETILHRIVRGTHLRGLAGMPAGRCLGESAVLLVRPLLGVHRDQVEAYLRGEGLSWRTDTTNQDTTFTRNFIRREVLPLLRDRVNARVDEALLRLADAAAQVETHVQREADRALGQALREISDGRAVLDGRVLAAEEPLVRACAIRTVLERLGAPMRNVGFERFLDLAGLAERGEPCAVALSGGFVARWDGERLVVNRGAADAGRETAAVALRCPGETTLSDGRRIVCRTEPFDGAAFQAHCRTHPPGVELLDADLLRGELICRARAAGDAFVPLGAPGRQSVSDFLTNRKLPRRRREQVLCICDGLGIVYVAPLRIEDRVRVTPNTRRVLRIEAQW